MTSAVRVRFAPSPTGYLHVGGARTVLYNWLFARHSGGKLILRIEDTDQARSTREAERMQIEDIRWLGIDCDEGPDADGPYGPYRQSERLDIYARYSRELLDSGHVFHCFCSDEDLERKRQAALKLGTVPQYDGACRDTPRYEAEKRIAEGGKAALRFRSIRREVRIQDAVRGEVVFPPGMVGDFIILRADGMPVYNFCCVIDDHLMRISHVLRAEEHLSNTVRQMMLYEAYGWEAPVFAHCSLILGHDRTKLSKRHGATSVHQYAEDGFLPEALGNFLALLGWSSPDHREILSREEMIARFSLERLHKAPSVFDPVKLRWMNGQYLRALPLADATARAAPFLGRAGLPVAAPDRVWLERAFDAVRSGCETLADAPAQMRVFFGDAVEFEADALKLARGEGAMRIIAALRDGLRAHLDVAGDALDERAFLAVQDAVKAATGAAGKALFMPMRAALTGRTHGPELRLLAPILGARRALARVERALSE